MENDFYEKVYQLVKLIPFGKVTTYGEVARAAGNPGASRVVGWALHVNPYFGQVPCHRVVNREGKLAEGFAFGGSKAQKHMLEDEGVEVIKNKVDLKKYGFYFW